MNIFHIAPLSLYDANELGFFFLMFALRILFFCLLASGTLSTSSGREG